MSQEKEADRPSPGRRIIDGIKEAIAGDFAAVTIDGVRWVRHEDQEAALRTAREEGYRQGVGARVKPLVWRRWLPQDTWRAITPFGCQYTVWEISPTGCWTDNYGGGPGHLVEGGLEAAKAGAQRDYEQRIMSALAEPGDGWLPIKDAPRIAGARYLATGGGLKERVCIVEWNERVGCWNVEDGPTLDDIDDELDGYSRPTLFQPLPSPPRIPSPGDTGE